MNTSKTQNTAAERPTAVELCCGVGGYSLGIEQAGFDVIAAADIEQIHVDTYRKNFPSCSVCRMDLTVTSGDEFRSQTKIGNRQIAALYSGPPCQGFSLIGKRSIEDPRNAVLLHVARLIRELSVTYFAIENVEGISLGSARGILDTFVRELENNGYSLVHPIRVLDAADFHVPQHRRRVFILGHKRGTPASTYPELHHNGNGNGNRPTVWDAIGDLPNIHKYQYLTNDEVYRGALGAATDYARVLRGEARDPDDLSPVRSRNGHGLTGCRRTKHTDDTVARFSATEQGETEKVSRFHRLAKDELCPTLRAGTGPTNGSFMAPRPIHPSQDRCITVREAARLHSFPDWFQFHETKWHAFRQIGNSVPPLLARAVAQQVRNALRKAATKG